ncbi:MAG TPA: hypothetical protein VGN15_05010, partial [Ktedonobacteraceae bacterium]|nr:hypothetical protein [Ktedonobacteraceae bacterium]
MIQHTTKTTSYNPISTRRLSYGLDINYHDRSIGLARLPQVLSLASASGATVIRTGVGWDELEPQPGVYQWTSLDKLLQLVRSHHLQLLLDIGGTPHWDVPPEASSSANATGYQPLDCGSGGDCQSFGTFMSALARHLLSSPDSTTVRGIVLRNEPQNSAQNWIGGTASSYATYQAAGYAAVHAVTSQWPVLNGGTEAPVPALIDARAPYRTDMAYAQQVTSFAMALYSDAAWCRSLDILDVHVGDAGPVYALQLVDRSEAALQACNGGKAVPVWVTEVSFSSLASIQQLPAVQAVVGDGYGGGAPGQSKYLADTFRALQGDHSVVGINWTFVVDPSGSTGA